jgi:hypothetical protein
MELLELQKHSHEKSKQIKDKFINFEILFICEHRVVSEEEEED